MASNLFPYIFWFCVNLGGNYRSATFTPSKCHFRTLKVPLSHPQSATFAPSSATLALRTAILRPPIYVISASEPCVSSLQTMRFQPPNHAFPASKLPFHAQPLHSTVGYGKGVGGLSNYFYNNYTLTPNLLIGKPLYLKAFPNVFKLSTPNIHLT